MEFLLLLILPAFLALVLRSYWGRAKRRSLNADEIIHEQQQDLQEQAAALLQENKAQKALLNEKELACTRAECKAQDYEVKLRAFDGMIQEAERKIKTLKEQVQQKELRVVQLNQQLRRAHQTTQSVSGAPRRTREFGTPTTPPLLQMNAEHDSYMRGPPDAITISPVLDNRSRCDLLSALIEQDRASAGLRLELQECMSQLEQANSNKAAAEDVASKQAHTNQQLQERLDQLCLDNERLRSTSQLLQAERSKLQGSSQQLQAEAERLRGMLESREQQVSELEHQLATQRIEQEQVTSDRDQLRESMQELQAHLQATKDELHALRNSSLASLGSLALTQDELDRQQQESALLTNTMERCEEQLDDMAVTVHHHARDLAEVVQEGVPELTSSLQEVEQLVDELREANRGLLQQLQSARQECDVLAAERSGLQRVRDALRVKVARVEADMEQLRASHSSEVSQFREQLDTLQFCVVEQKVHEQQLKDALQQLTASLPSLEAQLDQLTAANQELIAEQQRQQQQAAAKTSELQSLLDSAQNQVRNLQAEQQQARDQAAAKQEQDAADLQALTATLQSLYDELTLAKEKLQGQEAEKQQLQAHAAELKAQLDEVTAARQQQVDDITGLQLQVQQLTADKQQLQAQADNLSAQQEQLRSEKADVDSHLSDALERIKELQAAAAHAGQEAAASHTRLTEENQRLQTVADGLQQQVQQLTADRQRMQTHAEDLNAQLQQLRVEKAHVDCQVADLLAAEQQWRAHEGELQQQVQQLQQVENRMHKSVNELQAQIDRQASDLHASQMQLADLAADKQHVQQRADELQAEVEQVKQQLQAEMAISLLPNPASPRKVSKAGKLSPRESHTGVDKQQQQQQQRIQELEASVAQLTADKQQLQAYVDDLQAEVARLQSLAAMQASNLQLPSNVEVAAQLAQVHANLEAVQNKYARHLESSAAATKALQQELTSQLEAARAQEWSLKAALTTRLEAAQARISSLEQQLSTEQEGHARTLANLQATADKRQRELQAEAQAAKEQLVQMQQELALAQEETPRTQSELQSLREVAVEAVEVQQEMERLLDVNGKLSQNYASLRLLHDGVVGHRQELLEQIAALERDRAADQAKVSAMNMQFAFLKQDKAALQQQVEALEAALGVPPMEQHMQQTDRQGHAGTTSGHVFVGLDQGSGGASFELSAGSSSAADTGIIPITAGGTSLAAAASTHSNGLGTASNAPDSRADSAAQSPVMGLTASQELSTQQAGAVPGLLFRGLLNALATPRHDEGVIAAPEHELPQSVPPQLWESESSSPSSPITSADGQVASPAAQATATATPRATYESLPDSATSPLLSLPGCEASAVEVGAADQGVLSGGNSKTDVAVGSTTDQACRTPPVAGKPGTRRGVGSKGVGGGNMQL